MGGRLVLKEDKKIHLSENAIKVLEKRYLKRDASGKCIEGPADMFRRVADTIASGDLQFGKSQSDVDKLADRFYREQNAKNGLANLLQIQSSSFDNKNKKIKK